FHPFSPLVGFAPGRRIPLPSVSPLVGFAPDGQTLVTGRGTNFELGLWNPVTGQLRSSLGRREQGWIKQIAFSPDGKTLATAHYAPPGARLWDPQTEEPSHTLGGHSQAIEAVAFSTDGKTLATASRDGTARLWHVNTGQEMVVWSEYSPT